MTKQQSFLKRKSLWILLSLALVVLYPFESTMVPSKSVLVVSEDWRPVKGAQVRQTWQNYSLERHGHEEDLFTDEDGRVSFPSRKLRTNVVMQVIGPLTNILRQGVHASFGVHADILELGGGTASSSKPVEPQPGDVIFRRR